MESWLSLESMGRLDSTLWTLKRKCGFSVLPLLLTDMIALVMITVTWTSLPRTHTRDVCLLFLLAVLSLNLLHGILLLLCPAPPYYLSVHPCVCLHGCQKFFFGYIAKLETLNESADKLARSGWYLISELSLVSWHLYFSCSSRYYHHDSFFRLPIWYPSYKKSIFIDWKNVGPYRDLT